MKCLGQSLSAALVEALQGLEASMGWALPASALRLFLSAAVQCCFPSRCLLPDGFVMELVGTSSSGSAFCVADVDPFSTAW